ncbi:unnamed protein product [Timema podura]|uniref:Uncharacterized protein n=1 Tax=Timema podura TaxID=61482 RepID=A0ABN7PFB6_TIMPD|nr:unnamed protein product [Timema podura]
MPPGTLGVIWSVTWVYLVRDDPGQDPRISSQESSYLKEVLKQRTAPNQAVKYPWMGFVSSPAVWAIFVAHFVMDWGLFTSITQLPTFIRGKHFISITQLPTFIKGKHFISISQLPTFIKDTLKIDLEYIGYILATPYLVMIFVMQFTGRASDWLVGSNILSQTQTAEDRETEVRISVGRTEVVSFQNGLLYFQANAASPRSVAAVAVRLQPQSQVIVAAWTTHLKIKVSEYQRGGDQI